MRKSGLTGDEAYVLSKHGKTTEDLGPLKKEISLLKEDLSNKITKFYASNQGKTHITDSDNGKIQDMMLYGKSEQKQYSGKNLINSDEYYLEYKQNDGTYKGMANNFNKILVPVSKYIGTQITVSCKVTVPLDTSAVLIEAMINGTAIKGNKIESGKSGVIAVTIYPKTESDTIKITYDSGGVEIIVVSEFQIEKSSEATSYEPYVGGQPSPNPNYPQRIKSVVNPTMKVYGNNFYPGSDLIGLTKTYITDFMLVSLHEGKLHISFDTFSDTSDGQYYVVAQYYDKNKEQIGRNGNAKIVGNNISHKRIEFTGTEAESNYETINLQNVSYVKIIFGIYNNTATEITYKNIMVSATASDFEPYKPVQTVTLPYTLNAIPVSSGGNVTIDGQQYIADYVDVERGKLVRMCKETVFDGTEKWRSESSYMVVDIPNFNYVDSNSSKYMEYLFCNKYKVSVTIGNNDNIIFARRNGDGAVIKDTLHQSTVDNWKKYLNANPCIVYYLSAIPEEIDLTTEEITAFKSLVTYYPVTSISVNSEQLDGYTVFNYPISLANGWNYVKQQLNDNRDYIYDMDLQSAEAYVNSEYAVALTELEV